MRIHKLKIEDYKNLNNLLVDFDEKSFTTVLVGQNGTGKSNILEAIILIFRDLDLGYPPSFKYQIEYRCRGNKVSIDADPGRKGNIINIKVNDSKITLKNFSEQKRELYLPNYVFGYYSGPSNRMEMLFEAHQNKFYKYLIGKDSDEFSKKPLRPLLYARHIHSQFALLAFFYEKDEYITKFLKEYLGIEGFDSALFVIKEPPWDSKVGDARFWNARGSVQQLLSKLYDLSLAPLKVEQEIHIDFRRRSKLEHLYLYIPDIKSLEELSHQYANPQEFFKALESTYISKLIAEVRIRVKIKDRDGSLTFSELSEGEQQLLMVLGLLRFTREEESIFLLDEPDTHLNPAWSVNYLEILKDVVGEQETSQIILTTHDPLVISSLTRSQVVILRFDEMEKQFVAEHPENDPIKMGYPEILTSDIFKLNSIINPTIQLLLNEKRELAIKENLTAEELKQLSDLNKELDEFDFTKSVRDPLYEPFVRAMTEIKAEEKLNEPVLTKDQMDKRQLLAAQILRKIKAEKDQST